MFSASEMKTFDMFSVPHIATLVIFLCITLILIYFKGRLRPHTSLLKWTLFSILVISEVSYHSWLVFTGEWQIGELPLHLCSISTFICIYLFLKRSKNVFNFLFFTGMLPPILALVTPELFYQFPHYRFLQYFIHHAAIAWAVFYFIIYENYRVPRKAVLTSFITLNVIAVPIFIINLLLYTNFFYLASSTENETILSYFGTGLVYYVVLEIVAVFVFILTYLPMEMLIRKEKSNRVDLIEDSINK